MWKPFGSRANPAAARPGRGSARHFNSALHALSILVSKLRQGSTDGRCWEPTLWFDVGQAAGADCEFVAGMPLSNAGAGVQEDYAGPTPPRGSQSGPPELACEAS